MKISLAGKQEYLRWRNYMIILFIFAFAGHIIMLFTGLLKSACYHSAFFRDHSTLQSQRIYQIRLKRHWRITWILFALYIYAGLNLY